MRYAKDTKVILKSFLGTLNPESEIDVTDNYWKLIGVKGRVIEDKAFNENRVLVLFERNIDDYGLANHNPIKNSLWIKTSDLQIIKE